VRPLCLSKGIYFVYLPDQAGLPPCGTLHCFRKELWNIPHENIPDLWLGVSPRPRFHNHIPTPVFRLADIPFTLDTEPPAVRDPRPALTMISAVARTPAKIDPLSWVGMNSKDPDYRPVDYFLGNLYAPLGLTPETPGNPMQLTIEQALCAMTYWAAYVSRMESEVGAPAVPQSFGSQSG